MQGHIYGVILEINELYKSVTVCVSKYSQSKDKGQEHRRPGSNLQPLFP